ncbi:MAG: tyrosine-type recombinase/integrase [Methanothrix sp.]
MKHDISPGALLAAFADDCRLRGMKYYAGQVGYSREFLSTLEKSPLEIDRSDLKAYLTVLQQRSLKQTSIGKIFSALSNFYEFLTEEGLIQANPVQPFRKRYIKIYKEQVAQDVRQLISIEDGSKLVNSILDSRNKAILMLFLKTGMRCNELLALDVGDIDMIKMQIRLKPTTKRSNRLLFFDQETERALQHWLMARKNRNTHGSPALFPSKTSPRLSPREVQVEVEKHAARVGLHDPNSKLLEQRFTPHCCRHWFSTHLYRAGMEERYIAWLRGDAPRGAMGPYIHIDPEDVRRSYLAHIPQLGI